ncbi:MAG: aminotransferase class I/II-fold pyridoxal phosphate-dependent enzyme [Deltaproteobacteria bacterium]
MKRSDEKPFMGKATKAIHVGTSGDFTLGAVSVPIFQSAIFPFPSAEVGAEYFSGERAGYIYTRLGNPTVNALEESVAALENGEAGIATASGMAAINTVFLALLEQDAHVVCTASLYSATSRVLETAFSRFGVKSSFVDTSDLDNIKKAMGPKTRMIYIETPANPTMMMSDIQGAAEIARGNGSFLAVDNTFASPYVQRPLDHGADIVLHSLTKFINGHSDVLGGMIVCKTKELRQKIRAMRTLLGGVMDPHQAWLILRGLRTLPLRMEKSQEIALMLARFLKTHPNVTWVRYPGFPEHGQQEIAQKQMEGFGSMIAFGVRRGLEVVRILKTCGMIWNRL